MNPLDRQAAIDAIRRGARKDQLKGILETAEKKQEGTSFQSLKVTKPSQKRTGNQPQKEPTVKLADSAKPAPVGEFALMESMFDERASFTPQVSVPVQNQAGARTTELAPILGSDDNNFNMPGFNPLDAFEKKKQERLLQEKRAVSAPVNVIQEGQELGNQGQAPQFSYSYLKEMITEIANEVAEKKMNKVLDSYINNQKNGKTKTVEVVNKEKNLVKLDGKYFILKEVTVTKK